MSSCSTSQRSDRRPLLTELIKETLRREQEIREAQKNRRRCLWRSSKTAIWLGIGHLFFGLVLLIFDIATNEITHTAFGISSSLCFIITAILSFISARRLDWTAQWLIIFSASLSFALSLALVADCTLYMNRLCFPVQTERCTASTGSIHLVLVLIAFFESVLCVFSIFASYSHMKATNERTIDLMYDILVSGDFPHLPNQKPEQLSVTTVEESSKPVSLQTA
uniref:Membrane-spanning 4-domains subfamily A member 15-like n=2 Tax=Bursaphelenchus xylophilus TaxID=6326 RepID=A0A1I7SSA8_BURXY